MFIVLNVLVKDEVVQFLTTNKLCDLLVTRGLADDESWLSGSGEHWMATTLLSPANPS